MNTILKPGISQCMIVKDEEKNIERALSWGKGAVTEQIVVDTGSKDRTVEIARGMGATVYEFPWIDDFSAAKNYAISKAGCEWIAFLDADEYFSQEDGQKLARYVKQLDGKKLDGLLTAFVELDDEGNVMMAGSHLRIFRNTPELRYCRKVHESLKKDNGQEIQAGDLTKELTIYHTGYGKSESAQKKGSRRNLNMILAELDERPDDYEMHVYLGNEYGAVGEFEKAEACYRKAIMLMPEGVRSDYDVTTSGIWQKLLELLTLMPGKNEKDILEVYRQARERWPEDGDYDYLVGQYYGSRGNYQAGEKHLRQGLELVEKYGCMGKSNILSGHIMKAREMLAMCCCNNGNLEEAVQVAAMMLKENPYLMSTLIVMLSALLKDPGTGGRGREGAVETALFLGSNFYQLQSLKDRLFILQAAMGAGYQELVEVIKETLTQEEFVAVDKAMKGKLSRPGSQRKGAQLISVRSVVSGRERKNLRILLFYCSTESFNFFTDQLERELQKRGHETFILDLENPPAEDPHSYARFSDFIASGADAAVCYDGMCIRTEAMVEIWNHLNTAVIDMFMDPPLRFHLTLEHTPAKYHLFCCDYEHVEYVKKYFKNEVPKVDFMPHIGVLPEKNTNIIPYEKRKYDVLFCGTYYRPEEQMATIKKYCPEKTKVYRLYELIFENLKKNSRLSVSQGVLYTIEQLGWDVPESTLKEIMNLSNYVDWAIRMYQRGRVVTTLAEAGLELYLLGRGWENHPSSGMPNVHRIDDRIPYGETLAYMADARINLNVMPGFKEGTHDRIFNTLLQHSIPLTDSSTWIQENYTDGEDIVLYDLDHLELLPDIARRLLEDRNTAERIIERGYEKTAGKFTWSHCADWILHAIEEERD